MEKSLYSSKTTWKAIKEISYTSKTANASSELLEIRSTPENSIEFVNDFFASIGLKLANAITNTATQDTSATSNATLNSMVILPTDHEEIERLILCLKSDSATGSDGISPRFLQEARHLLVPPLTKIFNLCIDKGIFPKALKHALILPIYKSGDKHVVSNYRPISILPALSKIFEKLLNSRLMSFLNAQNLLANEQFGFRPGRSTEDAVLKLSQTVSEALDEKRKCMGIFLDLAKAFDTVSVPILVEKLDRLGIRGNCLKLFKDFLSHRTQRVKIGNLLSTETTITYGVPQGSILGPSLFLIYVNDLCNMAIPNAKIFTYADDTAIVFSGETWPEVFAEAESGMTKIIKWLNTNLLTLNIDKTKFITFTIRSNNSPPPQQLQLKAHSCSDTLTCNCPSLTKTSSIKYLGVLLDEHLTWLPHISLLSSRIRKLIWIFKKLRHLMDQSLLTSTYVAICQSVLTYCIPAWGGAYKSHMIILERAQRSVLKTMTFKRYQFPTKDLYENCQILTVRQLYILNVTLRTHKKIPLHPSHTRRRYRIKNILHRTDFKQHQFDFLATHIYNKINKILSIHTLNLNNCKQTLRKWLLGQSYDDTEALLHIIK